MSIDNSFGGITNYPGSDRDGPTAEETQPALSSNQSTAAADGSAPVEFEPAAEFQNKSYELAFLGSQLRERVLRSASTEGGAGSQVKVAYTVKLPDDPAKRYDSREVRKRRATSSPDTSSICWRRSGVRASAANWPGLCRSAPNSCAKSSTSSTGRRAPRSGAAWPAL